MNSLLIFFAFPIATIILSGIFETIINCPFKIAGIVFSIFLIIAFSFGATAELILAVIIYTILAFLTSLLVLFFQNRNVAQNTDNNNSLGSYNMPLKSSCNCGRRNR